MRKNLKLLVSVAVILFVLTAFAVSCAPARPYVSELSVAGKAVNINLPNALIGDDGLPVIEGVTPANYNCAYVFYVDTSKKLKAITFCPGGSNNE